jgi:hypothetical protein
MAEPFGPIDGGRAGSVSERADAPCEEESARWRIQPEGRNRWLLLREEEPIAELGRLGTGEWWVSPVADGLPWAETYASRPAASRAVVVWWLHTHPFAQG